MLVESLLAEKERVRLKGKSQPRAKFRPRAKSEPKNKKRKVEGPGEKVKIARKENKATTRVKFGNLKMMPLKKYDIPVEFSDIEKGIDASHLDVIRSAIDSSESNQIQYTYAYSALLYLTEAAESISLDDFNQNSIRMSYSRLGRTFQIKNSVSSE